MNMPIPDTSYLGDCRYLIDHGATTQAAIVHMGADASEITQAEFEKHCGPLDEARKAELASDPSSAFYWGKLGQKYVYFFRYAGFEFIWSIL